MSSLNKRILVAVYFICVACAIAAHALPPPPVEENRAKRASELTDPESPEMRARKEEYKRQMEEEIAKARGDANDINISIGQAAGELKNVFNKSLDTLNSRRGEINAQLDRAAENMGPALEQMRSGFEKALVELQTAFGQAKKEMQAKKKPAPEDAEKESKKQ